MSVETPQVRDDDVARDELDHEPAEEPRPQPAGDRRRVVAVAAERLERGDGPAVGGGKLVGPRQRRLPSQLGEHLALLRAVQVERVEELRDLVVALVAALVDDLEPVEPGIDVVEDGLALPAFGAARRYPERTRASCPTESGKRKTPRARSPCPDEWLLCRIGRV
jgi:hypothetical protein